MRVVALAALVAAGSLVGCANGRLRLISREDAQERIYDSVSRAEALRMVGRHKSARSERERARHYWRLIREGRTTTAEQALDQAVRHRQLADQYQDAGYVKYAAGELERAAQYEDFAAAARGLPPERAQDRAYQHRQRATAYRRLGFGRFATHYERQAKKLERVAQAPPLPPAPAGGDDT